MTIKPLVLFALLGVTACATPTTVGRVRSEPFMPENQNPLLVETTHSWVDPQPDEREAAFQLSERVLIPSSEVVSLDFRSTPLANAIHMIAQIADVNIYLDAQHNALIDASFPNVRLDEALEVVLLRNGLALEQLAGGVYSVRVSDGDTPTTARFKLLSSHALEVAAKLTEILGEGVSVVGDPSLNVVLVQGTRSDAERAAEIVETIDQRRPQVLIEVGVYEASIDDGFELGISHSFSDVVDGSAVDILQNLATPDTQFSLTFGNSPGSLETTIQALRSHVGVELISSPRVMTASSTEALVEIVEEIPYIQTTSTITTGAGTGSGSNVAQVVEYKEAGISLTVLPTIHGDGLIEIKIDQTVSEVVDVFNDIPVIDKQHIDTTFFVAAGQTAVLGGLMQDRRRSVNESVPLLGNIPILGRLFRKDEDQTQKRELLVFVTPRVLDPLQAARIAEEYKRNYREQRREFDLPTLPAEGSGDLTTEGN